MFNVKQDFVISMAEHALKPSGCFNNFAESLVSFAQGRGATIIFVILQWIKNTT